MAPSSPKVSNFSHSCKHSRGQGFLPASVYCSSQCQEQCFRGGVLYIREGGREEGERKKRDRSSIHFTRTRDPSELTGDSKEMAKELSFRFFSVNMSLISHNQKTTCPKAPPAKAGSFLLIFPHLRTTFFREESPQEVRGIMPSINLSSHLSVPSHLKR